MATITHAATGTTLEFDFLPESSIISLAQKGLTHFLGSEAASRLTAKVNAEAGVESTATKTEGEAARKAWIEANPEDFKKMKDSIIAEFVASVREGTMAIRAASAPRGNPVETEARAIAKRELKNQLKPHGVKLPEKKGETVTISGVAYTLAQLIDRRLTDDAPYGHGTRIRKEAAARVAKEAKAASAPTEPLVV